MKMNFRKRLGRWLLGNDIRVVENRYIIHNPKMVKLQSQHVYFKDNYSDDTDRLHGIITRNVITELVEQVINSDMVSIVTTYDERTRESKIMATMNVMEIEKK